MSLLMGRLATELRHVDAEVAAEIRRYHLRRQLVTLATGVAVSLAASFSSGGAGPLDWRAVVPVLVSAVCTQLAKQAPLVPWDMLRVRLGLPGVPSVPAPSVLGLPVIPDGGTSEVRTAQGTGVPMTDIRVEPGGTGTVQYPPPERLPGGGGGR